MGDFNAQVGSFRNGYERSMGSHAFGNRNVEGIHVLDLCLRKDLVVSNTLFKKKYTHKFTRYNWDDKYRTEIDYTH